jgi:hypothetical protein
MEIIDAVYSVFSLYSYIASTYCGKIVTKCGVEIAYCEVERFL